MLIQCIQYYTLAVGGVTPPSTWIGLCTLVQVKALTHIITSLQVRYSSGQTCVYMWQCIQTQCTISEGKSVVNLTVFD